MHMMQLLFSLCRTGLQQMVVASILLAATAAAQDEKIRLNMNNADIKTVIQWIAEQTNKNFIIDPRVKGRLSVLSNQPMTMDEAYQVFLAALDVYGFAAIESGNNVKIIPNAQARTAGLPVLESFTNADGQSEELVLHVISVENIQANELVAILRPLVPQTGHLAAFPNNTVLIADRAANIGRMLQLIRHVDSAGVIDIEVIALEHATASEIIEVLNPLFSNRVSGSAGGNAPGLLSLASDERTNSILMAGDPEKRDQIKLLIAELDSPLQGRANTQVIYLNYIDAAEVVPILEGMTGSLQGETKNVAIAKSEVSIQASETTNALIITAPPSILETINGVIEKLDIRRQQVLIEAIIAEVSDTFNEDVEIFWSTTDNTAGNGVGSINLSSLASVPTSGDDSLASLVRTGLNFGYFRNGNLRALLRFIQTNTSNNILSTPSLITLDNEEAEILVGRNIPFVTGSRTSAASDITNPFQTIQREDVGITLKVTPKVNQARTMTLEIEQEVEDVTETAVADAQDLVTDKRSIKTQVLLGDGEILVLGGLIEDKLTTTQRRVPVLGSIPVLGRLFRDSSETITKQNLMVFLRASIIDDAASAERATEHRYEHMRELQDSTRKERMNGETPTLPAYQGNATGLPLYENTVSTSTEEDEKQ